MSADDVGDVVGSRPATPARDDAARVSIRRRSILVAAVSALAAACTTTEHITITLDEDRSAFGLRNQSSRQQRVFPDTRDANRISAMPSLTPGDLPSNEARPSPVSIRADRLNLESAEVVSVGVDDAGNFEVPDRLQIGWYRFGPTPGETGSAVLAAHVALNGLEGLFRHLDAFERGDQVDVVFDNGDTKTFEIQGIAQYNKDVVPLDELFVRTGAPRLILITCGGSFNPQLNSFDDNLIAFATPIDGGEPVTS